MEPTTIEKLPQEVCSKILVRVASKSAHDFFNAKHSFRHLMEAAECDEIYEKINLEDLRLNSKAFVPLGLYEFLNRCEKNGHSEVIFRRALVNVRGSNTLVAAFPRLREAIGKGYAPARYALGLFLIMLGEETKPEGMNLLRELDLKKINEFRDQLISILFPVFYKPQMPEYVSPCCKIHDCPGWIKSWDVCDADFSCFPCIWDRELYRIKMWFPKQYAPVD